jgi:hypothetical protein
MSIVEVEKRIKNYLIDGEWFYADKWGLADMHFEKWDNEIDHLWHEYHCLEETDEDGQIDIEALLQRIASV